MSVGLENLTNVSGVTADYPWKNIKDNTGIGNGTPLNQISHADYHQTFRKFLAMAGINPNGNPDNVTNGYQYIEALNKLYKNYTGVTTTAVGVTLTYVNVGHLVNSVGHAGTIIHGLPVSTVTQMNEGDVFTFVNQENFTVDVHANGSDVINFKGADSGTFKLYSKGDFCTFVLDKANARWYVINYRINNIAVAPNLLNSWVVYLTQTPKYKIFENNVFLEGTIQKTGASTGVMFTLPVEARPSVDRHITCTDANSYSINVLNISSATGDVSLIISTGVSSLIYLDGIIYSL